MSGEPFERYRELIDDWSAFSAALERPEPTTLRVNRMRASVAEVRAALESEGFSLEPLAGQPWMLRVLDGPRSVSDTWGHWAGDFYIQQASTGVAVALLDPQPGEKVLDMCAAPGGKTTHIAEAMQGRGEVVAVEVNDGRIRALLGNIYRLGLPDILVIGADGRTLPTEAQFHRVLVDVPCSAQGTYRKKAGRLPARSARFMKQVTRSQEALLRRAFDVTAPGGVILYVTCTFGPEENEAVVSRVLADPVIGPQLEVEMLDPGVPHARGAVAFEDQRFDPRMERAVRLYPHHLDSGGLFLCRLRKAGDPVEQAARDAASATLPGWDPVPVAWPGEDAARAEQAIDDAVSGLAQHYGVDPAAFEGMHWMMRGHALWLHGMRDWPLEAWTPGGHWRMQALGLRAMDLRGDGPPRPTNDLLQWLDTRITHNRIELDAADWCSVLDGREVRIADIERGHVALAWKGHVAGWGFVRDHRLEHHIPGGRLNWLRNVVSPTSPPAPRARSEDR